MTRIIVALGLLLTLISTSLHAQELSITLELPEIDSSPYHKPYVAVWIETPTRKGVHTLAFWREQSKWFKDLRQWWRKIGRKGSPTYDAVSGATKKPGTYTLHWDGKNSAGNKVATGQYIVHLEAVREEGGREYVRQAISLGHGKDQQYTLQGATELGAITISITQE